MPFAYGPFVFSDAGTNGMKETGGVYGLARPHPVPGNYTILYVGKTGNLRERLRTHLNNPPVTGVTHFFAEAIDSDAARTQREETLISEFKPIGNTLLK